MSSSNDSSSDSEDDSIFQSICDPTMSANYGSNTKNARTGFSKVDEKIDLVTGDDFIDRTLWSLRRNLDSLAAQKLDKSSASTKEGAERRVPARFVSQRTPVSNSCRGDARGGAPVAVPYAVKRMAQVLDSQITIRSHNKRPKHRQQEPMDESGSNSHPEDLNENGVGERLQLMEGVAYDPNLPEQNLNQTNNEWLRKLKKRYNPCCYSSEEEDAVESRCRELALSATMIASGGLKSIYAEHRNTNPLKVERVRLCKKSKNGVLLIAPRAKDCETKAVPEAKKSAAMKHAAGGGVCDASDTADTPKQCLPTKEVVNTTGSPNPSVKKVKKKSRKRGPKKKKASTNGNNLEESSKTVAVE